MSADQLRQSRLLGEPADESLSAQTSGRVIRPALGLPKAVVGECKLCIDGDGLSITAVDPANVVLIDFTIHARAFDSYTFDAADELVIGTNLQKLTTALGRARKGKRTDDAVALDFDAVRTIVEIEREYDQTRLEYADEVLSIDPDSIRQEPEVPTMDLVASAAVDVDAFGHAVDHINSVDKHIAYRVRDGALLLTGGSHDDSPANYASAVRFGSTDVACDDVPGPTYFSLNYVADIVDGLSTGLIDSVTLRWGEEFPCFFEFERTNGDGDVLYDGRYMLAPRVGGGD
jgi:proliferating cell nuclear antigen